jgi:hypothetical protein
MSFSPEELTRDSLSDRQSIKSLWSPTWAHQCGDSNVAEPCFIGPRGLDVVEQPLATNSAPISRLRATLRQFESHPQFRSEKYVDDKIWTLPKPRLFSKRKSKNPTPVKKTRSGLAAKEVGEQLIVDAAKYAQHPDCQALFCFVYDPEGRIANPIGIERDLARKDGGMEVEVFIYPKGT